MNFTIDGDFGSIGFRSNGGSRFLEIPADTAHFLFDKIALKYPELALSNLGLFQLGSVGRKKKGKLMSLTTPKHILQSRKNGCTWNSKGSVSVDLTDITLCPVEYMGEQCPDAFWGDCLETIFGEGRKVHDFFGTSEGQELMMKILKQVYIGLGNSFFELAWWGQHPLIDSAETNGWYAVSRSEWEDYLDQQQACAGWMTMIDDLKAKGAHLNLTVPIYSTDVSGKDYTGSAVALIDRVLSNATSEFDNILDADSTGLEPIILVSAGIYDRFVEEMTLQFNCIPASMEYWINGTTTVGGNRLVRNALRYKGYIIYKASAFKLFDQITGTVTHRVLVSAPKNFGMIYDIPELEQFAGMGLQVTQKLEAPYKGKVYMDTTFKMGTAIADVNALINASLTLTPTI